MAQQTLEEAADNYSKELTQVVAFYNGAKWQQEKARRMHKEQMIDFGRKCQMVHPVEYGDGAVTFISTPEELYEQTYKTT